LKPDYKRLAVLEARIGYEFSDKDLALRALTHSSFGDGRRELPNNERLEFLGDRVLGFLTAEKLFLKDLGGEGMMARRLNALVRKETCARVANRIDLGRALLISPAEEKQGGREKPSILGDACEALIAAIYLDGGFDPARIFFETFWKKELANIDGSDAKDPKTQLQEQVSILYKAVPVYEITERSGPDHRPHFVITVSVKGAGSALGEGASKKDAERAAASALLRQIKSEKAKLS